MYFQLCKEKNQNLLPNNHSVFLTSEGSYIDIASDQHNVVLVAGFYTNGVNIHIRCVIVFIARTQLFLYTFTSH